MTIVNRRPPASQTSAASSDKPACRRSGWRICERPAVSDLPAHRPSRSRTISQYLHRTQPPLPCIFVRMGPLVSYSSEGLPDPVVIIRYGLLYVPSPVVRFATLSPTASRPIRLAGLAKRFAWRLSLTEELPGLNYHSGADTPSRIRAPSNFAGSVRQVLLNQGQHLKRNPHFLRALNAKADVLIEWKPLD